MKYVQINVHDLLPVNGVSMELVKQLDWSRSLVASLP